MRNRKTKQKPKVMTLITSEGRIEAVAMALAFTALDVSSREALRYRARSIIESLRVASVR